MQSHATQLMNFLMCSVSYHLLCTQYSGLWSSFQDFGIFIADAMLLPCYNAKLFFSLKSNIHRLYTS